MAAAVSLGAALLLGRQVVSRRRELVSAAREFGIGSDELRVGQRWAVGSRASTGLPGGLPRPDVRLLSSGFGRRYGVGLGYFCVGFDR